jgi:hypothetical protein
MTEIQKIIELHEEQVKVFVFLADLENRCREAKQESRFYDAKTDAQQALSILTAMIRKYYAWIFDDLPWTELPVPAQEQTAHARPSTHSVRKRQKIADTLDAGCIVPPDLVPDLYMALRALDQGEIQDLLAHVPAKQWGNAQEMARTRLAVLRHVHFLVGKGATAIRAREIVSEAIHKSPSAIRSWETTELPKLYPDLDRVLEIAREAGRVRMALPGELPSDGLDDLVRSMIIDIEDLPLSTLQQRLAALGSKPKVRNPLRNRHKKVLGNTALT